MPAGPTEPNPGPVLAIQAITVDRASVRLTPENIIKEVLTKTTVMCRAKKAETLAAKLLEIVCLPNRKGK